jgi:hypothetical protein
MEQIKLVNSIIRNPESFNNTHQFWIGTSPFCGANSNDCKKIGGGIYEAVPNHKILSKDKRKYGKECLTGKKVLCRINENSDKFKEVKSKFLDKALVNYDLGDKYSLKWFGTSPFCNPSECDVLEEGYIPILTDNRGDGSKCLTGNKILGFKPKNPNDFDKKFIEESKAKCLEETKLHFSGGLYSHEYKSTDNIKKWYDFAKVFNLGREIVDHLMTNFGDYFVG